MLEPLDEAGREEVETFLEKRVSLRLSLSIGSPWSRRLGGLWYAARSGRGY